MKPIEKILRASHRFIALLIIIFPSRTGIALLFHLAECVYDIMRRRELTIFNTKGTDINTTVLLWLPCNRVGCYCC